MTRVVIYATAVGDIEYMHGPRERLWRVGHPTSVFDWSDWTYVKEGRRFGNRWDDPGAQWRTLYLGDCRLACFLEVLAVYRADPKLEADLDVIVDDADSVRDAHLATPPSGTVPRDWLLTRYVGSAVVEGWYAVPTHSVSLASLRSTFLSHAHRLGFADFDAAALRDAKVRALTQDVSAHLHGLVGPEGELTAGIRFWSRHGDDLGLWAVYEYPRSGEVCSPRILETISGPIDDADAELLEALRLHGLTLGA